MVHPSVRLSGPLPKGLNGTLFRVAYNISWWYFKGFRLVAHGGTLYEFRIIVHVTLSQWIQLVTHGTLSEFQIF